MIILVTPRLVDPFDCTRFPKYLPGRETRNPDDFELFLEGILEAPRGQRSVVFHPHHYKPAFQGSSSMAQFPCGDGNCGNGHGGAGCANGNCGAPVSSYSNRPANYLAPAVTTMPNFPDAPPSNFRVTVENSEPMPVRPALGPVSSPMPANPMPPAREFENRPSLPPVTPGYV